MFLLVRGLLDTVVAVRSRLPVPPVELAMRAGGVEGSDGERLEQYDWVGASLKQAIVSSLPNDWSWSGRRSLDFGCGAGRVLRHFVDEAEAGEMWGCDIDQLSVAWLRERLCPPFHPFLVSELPRLPLEDGYFDVVWAMSVFTHLVEHWAGWLLELHRVLKPGGHLIATFLGANMTEDLPTEPWDEDRIGMQVLGFGRPWSEGGPSVFHSEWWLRAHWGRIFDVVKVDRNEGRPGIQGLIALRKRPVRETSAGLELPEPGEPRELVADQSALAALYAENRLLRQRVSQLETELEYRWYARLAAKMARYSAKISDRRDASRR